MIMFQLFHFYAQFQWFLPKQMSHPKTYIIISAFVFLSAATKLGRNLIFQKAIYLRILFVLCSMAPFWPCSRSPEEKKTSKIWTRVKCRNCLCLLINHTQKICANVFLIIDAGALWTSESERYFLINPSSGSLCYLHNCLIRIDWISASSNTFHPLNG